MSEMQVHPIRTTAKHHDRNVSQIWPVYHRFVNYQDSRVLSLLPESGAPPAGLPCCDSPTGMPYRGLNISDGIDPFDRDHSLP